MDIKYGGKFSVTNYARSKLVNTYDYVGFSRQSWYIGGGSSYPTT